MQGIKKDIDLQNRINANKASGGTHKVITLVVEGTDENTTAEAIYGVNLVDLSSVTDFCCKLPDGVTGRTVIIQNRSGGPIDVYPPDPLSQINQNGVGLPVQIPNDWKQYSFICIENPAPSIWSLSAPSTFDLDSGVLEMPTHTESTNGYNNANSTWAWFGSAGTAQQTNRLGTGYSMSWAGSPYNGWISFNSPGPSGWFQHTTSPATINKIKIYSNILDENLSLSGTPSCSNGVLGTAGQPCYNTDLGTAGSNSDFGARNGGMPMGYQYGPVLMIWRVQSTMMVTGTITAVDPLNPNLLIDSSKNFNTCFAGNPVGNYPGYPANGSLITNYNAPWVGGGAPGPTASAATIVSPTEIEMNAPFSSMAVNDPYGIKLGPNGDQTSLMYRMDLERGICCANGTFNNYDCNTSWLPMDFCNEYIDVAKTGGGAPVYAGNPGDAGTLYAETDVAATGLFGGASNANRQIGSAPIQPNLIDGQSYYYYTIFIPAYMATKDYKFQVILECQ